MKFPQPGFIEGVKSKGNEEKNKELIPTVEVVVLRKFRSEKLVEAPEEASLQVRMVITDIAVLVGDIM